MLFLAASRTCSVGPKVGGVGWKVDGCYAFQGLAGGVEVGQGPGVVEPGVVQDDGDLLSLLGLALKTVHHEDGLLDVLIAKACMPNTCWVRNCSVGRLSALPGNTRPKQNK